MSARIEGGDAHENGAPLRILFCFFARPYYFIIILKREGRAVYIVHGVFLKLF